MVAAEASPPAPLFAGVSGALQANKYAACHSARAEQTHNAGLNENGQLGTGKTISHELTPALVADRHVFAHIAAGWFHTCGIDRDGMAWCWGE